MSDQKLTDGQVRQLCQRWDSGEWTMTELLEQYGITAPTLYRYVRRQRPRAAALAPLTGPTAGAPDGRNRSHPDDYGIDVPSQAALRGVARQQRNRATYGHRSSAPGSRLR